MSFDVTAAPLRRGPLVGLRVVEISSIGPIPLACTLLSDMGADVIRIDRPAEHRRERPVRATDDILSRGRTNLVADLRTQAGVASVLELVATADVLVEGLRPGVMERLGLGPEACHARNPRLVYGRMTGWGQSGPRRTMAGHDLNYLALTGVLHALGPRDRPPSPPLNLIADYGGGAMLLAFGVAAALLERHRSGAGQVVDAAMVDGVALQTAVFHSMLASGTWTLDRESNLLDGGAHFYRVYETADGRFVAVAAIEPQFYAELLERLGLPPSEWPQDRRDHWPQLRERMADIFRQHPLTHWGTLFADGDACVTPVNTFAEALADPHLVERETFTTAFGIRQPSPAPRYSRTPGRISRPPEE